MFVVVSFVSRHATVLAARERPGDYSKEQSMQVLSFYGFRARSLEDKRIRAKYDCKLGWTSGSLEKSPIQVRVQESSHRCGRPAVLCRMGLQFNSLKKFCSYCQSLDLHIMIALSRCCGLSLEIPNLEMWPAQFSLRSKKSQVIQQIFLF